MEPLTGPLRAGWWCEPLDELCQLQAGPSGALVGSNVQGRGGVPLVVPGALDDGRIRTGLVRTPVADRFDVRRFELRAGDLIGVRSGDLGRFALVDEAACGAVCSTSMLRLRVTDGRVDPRYLLHYLHLPSVAEWVRRGGTGTTVAIVRLDRLRTLPIAVPPGAEQADIVRRIELLHRHAALHAEIARQSRTVRAELASSLIDTRELNDTSATH